MLRLIEPTAGEIRLDGRDFLAVKGRELRRLRRRMQMIFQDPYASLDPRLPVHAIVSEPLEVAGGIGRRELRERVDHLLDLVGLDTGSRNRYPHEFSGGQRQRVGIARALALDPDLVVCDEAIASLDVSIQAQIVNLLERLQEHFRFSYLFIAHDLSMVRHVSNRIAVMYLGKIVEVAPTEALFENPGASLYPGADVRGPGAGSRHRSHPPAHHPGGRHPEPLRPPSRLRVPHPLPGRDGTVLSTSPAGPRGRKRALRRLPSRRRTGSACLNALRTNHVVPHSCSISARGFPLVKGMTAVDAVRGQMSRSSLRDTGGASPPWPAHRGSDGVDANAVDRAKAFRSRGSGGQNPLTFAAWTR